MKTTTTTTNFHGRIIKTVAPEKRLTLTEWQALRQSGFSTERTTLQFCFITKTNKN